MKNKIKFSYLILLACCLALFLIPTAQADYPNCDYDIVDPSDCCLDGEEGYQGVYCNPGEYIQKIGSNSPSCKTSADILGRAGDADTKNFAGFNCFNNQLDKTCQPGLCYNPGADACQAFGGDNPDCDSLNRKTNCDQSCNGCKSGFISCGATCQAPIDVTCGDGYEPDYCTGTCGCETGYTPSGLVEGVCVSFLERFREIFDFGLTSLGGIELTYAGASLINAYSYGAITDTVSWSDFTDPDFYGNIFVEVDLSDHLNWASPTVPAPIQDLITNNNYTFCTDDSDCDTGNGEYCLAGLCYNPGAHPGDGCTDPSDCPMGYVCDASGVCALPSGNTNNVVYVDQTAVKDGDQGGYLFADNLCGGVVTGSHICTAAEMIQSYVLGVVALPGAGYAWINNGPPGYVKYVNNDCAGWTTNASTVFGPYWDFDNSRFLVAPCNQSLPIACCK